ncbi:MAG: CTP synthase [Malacoplasma sp.]|nr:CTP synthase [Malacoplasma sp.]
MVDKLNSKTKILIVTGGVFSSLGKGVACSSLGALLKNYNQKVTIMKFDPYLNVDAGTMSPGQHGEVYVTQDGGETDLDIGNYERFLNIDLTIDNNLTAGKVCYETIKKERNGEYLGSTIQVIPHITNTIISKIVAMANKDEPDFLIIEVGGTVGDIESEPFLEVTRQLQVKYRSQFMVIHTVPIISLLINQEIKTKPLQHSVKTLMSYGIFPNLLLVRSQNELPNKIKDKISWTTGIETSNIFSLMNLNPIYLMPQSLEAQNIQQVIFDYFNMKNVVRTGFKHWDKFIECITKPKKYIANIAIVGKYLDASDTYLSIYSSLEIAAIYLNCDLKTEFIDSQSINEDNVKILDEFDGIIVPGGFGRRGVEGKICAIKYARENKKPFFGICLGMQLSLVEYARNVLNLKDANSTEFDENTTNPIITILAGKDKDINLGGTLRLGNYSCMLKQDSLAKRIYKQDKIVERHRHRYEFNPKYLDAFANTDMVLSGINNDNGLVEIVELNNHPFFIATQFHPEFTTKILSPNLIFYNFLNTVKKLKPENEQK